ncbi:phage-related baseplate assembly protein [Rhizobium subbaraonis]|uniref:Phage-related baseplate assembly protein n=1 Tax=Rhizobium subbaraonis TaxID=908946 RepID=A0A285V0V5_9HYPH|nr:baseplate J/gp47 family protein [Rhizobium subbaraonis]SOC47690.1 phage-related baseplate assembly protein [Rhizobium subbaraonis]
MTSQVDLSALPAPRVIEELSFETILAEMKADLVVRFPAIEPVLQLESSVALKVMEACAYRELILRARLNDAARSLLLARAVGSDLDHIAANFGVVRLIVTPATTLNPAVLEDDERLRRRVLLAIEAYSVAGPADAYVYHALTAVPSLRDATAISPEPGKVVVTIMASGADPVPTAEALTTVAMALRADDVRPLTDNVSVLAPEVVDVSIAAGITVFPGPDGTIVVEQARAKLQTWLAENALLGRDLRLSAIFSRLHVDGVRSVSLHSPGADVVVGPRQIVRVVSVSVVAAGVDE